MFVTLFTDLPDLVILDILRYLTPDDAIRAFYNIDNNTERILNLLIENGCFSTIQHFRLPLFNFVCDNILPRVGSKFSHLTLYEHQLALAHRKKILLHLPNVISLHLKSIVDILDNDNHVSYFLHQQLKSLTVEFLSEHHIEAQAYICEQFIFNKKSENLIDCQLLNTYGIQLRHLILFPNYSIERMTIKVKELSDLHILFDHVVNIKILNVELLRWTVEDVKYDYAKLPKKLPHLTDLSIQSVYTLSFTQILTIIRYLIHLQKLSFIYRNYDASGIDMNQLVLTLNHLNKLTELHFIISFVYFNLNPKQTFENNADLKEQWNVHTYNNLLYKNYLAYTKPFMYQNYSMSSDVLLEDDMSDFSPVTNLSLTTHTKKLSLSSVVRLLNRHFSSVSHLHIVDSFGIDSNDNYDFQLLNVHSLDVSELKVSYWLQILLRSIPNLTRLSVNSNILIDCNIKLLFIKTTIKHLELITNDLDKIHNIIPHFLKLEKLIINCKKQANHFNRKSIQIVFNWFSICSPLYRIHIKADKLSELFSLVYMKSDENMQIQYSNEMLSVWK